MESKLIYTFIQKMITLRILLDQVIIIPNECFFVEDEFEEYKKNYDKDGMLGPIFAYFNKSFDRYNDFIKNKLEKSSFEERDLFFNVRNMMIGNINDLQYNALNNYFDTQNFMKSFNYIKLQNEANQRMAKMNQQIVGQYSQTDQPPCCGNCECKKETTNE